MKDSLIKNVLFIDFVINGNTNRKRKSSVKSRIDSVV